MSAATTAPGTGPARRVDSGPAAVHIIIFAKAPVAGLAKTRLIPALGAEGAAALAQCMLEHTVAAAVGAGLGSIELCRTPQAGHPALLRLAEQYPHVALTTQGEGDLGQRMARAFQRALRAHAQVLLIGTDAPALDAALLRDAARALAAVDAVFVPALDGGYVLVGLRRNAPALFAGIAWSSASVMQASRERAARAGLRLAELAPVADIDEPADLVHAPAQWLAGAAGTALAR